ncbi:predicted protein [Chaetoceros tenuissimus]|uniref:Uncharacterized protein n=1 Tax=Chaetoceros tenuissimus TaxID=426638 RepID=A0AAD3D195_9STRA|nr:predicted protein [Chaetoceros tenuissimus]
MLREYIYIALGKHEVTGMKNFHHVNNTNILLEKATSAPSSKTPKSTKSPGAAASSSATASMSAASVAAGALVWFSL